ncbi:VOC family protein [Streptomyces sp. NPDC059900]|uniref:VOC family protein n=1 Tax=Streptomyces sp. NPDC059900 TaxID=3155816 RepID=UPI0034427832
MRDHALLHPAQHNVQPFLRGSSVSGPSAHRATTTRNGGWSTKYPHREEQPPGGTGPRSPQGHPRTGRFQAASAGAALVRRLHTHGSNSPAPETYCCPRPTVACTKDWPCSGAPTASPNARTLRARSSSKPCVDFAGLVCADEVFVGFQRVDGYRAPLWPEQTVPQQVHLCFTVKHDWDQVEARLPDLGAGQPDHQPRGARAGVRTDPVGHLAALAGRLTEEFPHPVEPTASTPAEEGD